MSGHIGFRPSTWVDGTRLDLPRPQALPYPSHEKLLEKLTNDILRNPPMPASQGRRGAAGVIDLALLGLVWKGLAAFAVAATSATIPSAIPEIGAFVVTSVLAAIYMVGCWELWGASLGMALMRIGVGDQRFGGPLGRRQAIRRFVTCFLVGVPAFLVMLISRDPWHRTWYDRASRTVVLAE